MLFKADVRFGNSLLFNHYKRLGGFFFTSMDVSLSGLYNFSKAPLSLETAQIALARECIEDRERAPILAGILYF